MSSEILLAQSISFYLCIRVNHGDDSTLATAQYTARFAATLTILPTITSLMEHLPNHVGTDRGKFIATVGS